MSKPPSSNDSLSAATRSRAKFSGHGNAKGAAGYRTEKTPKNGEFLSGSGETAIINPHEDGFKGIVIGAAWDNVVIQKAGFIDKLLKKATKQGVDIDLGCLYELQDGTRGAIQAFGELFGAYNEAPYITLSGDERTGDTEGDDESLFINGKNWPEIKRILIYVYIYDGVPNWQIIRPQIEIRVPGEKPVIAVPDVHRSELNLCAICGMENVRNGIKMTNYTEYFPGHSEMDRAFGFGIEWSTGQKDS